MIGELPRDWTGLPLGTMAAIRDELEARNYLRHHLIAIYLNGGGDEGPVPFMTEEQLIDEIVDQEHEKQ